MAHVVATVVVEGANPFEFAIACEVFGIDRAELGVEWYDHRLVGVSRPVTIAGGVRLDPPYDLAALEHADTVIVPACSLDVPVALIDPLRAAYHRGARMVSFCSGAFALAAAGVLDRRTAATHWLYTDELQRRYPNVAVDGDVLYIDDGQVLTSAGTAAGIDLALHIVRMDHGAEIANHVARRMVVPPHRDGGQAQYAVEPVPRTLDDDRLGPVLEWMVEHLDEPMTVDGLARMAAMSPRSFARHFKGTTGTTPLRWLNHQRVVRTQELLEVTDRPIDVIARDVGFGTAANLRVHFRRVTSTTPDAYRRRFRRSAA